MEARTGGPTWSVPGYDVVELLGFGASGEVWLAWEVSSGEHVALKRLRTPQGLPGRDRLRREAAALAGVQHPHVVRLRTLVSAGEELVLVLDLAAGGSLSRVLATRRLGAGEVVTVAVPLAEALATVHAQGLVHGDVTPANVLFTDDGRPLLSDLGVCGLVAESPSDLVSGTTVVRGTPGFLDPALLAGVAAGPASDVHGLAAVCYAALTGTAPYDPGGRRRGRLRERVPTVPPALAELVESALDRDPGRRPDAPSFAGALFACCPAEPVALLAPPSRTTIGSGREVSELDALTHEVLIDGVPARLTGSPPPGDVGAADDRPRHAHRQRLGERARALRAVGWRPVGGALVVMCALSMAVLTGMAWAGARGSDAAAVGATKAASDARSVPTAAEARPLARPAAVEWAAVLGRLDAIRSDAFARADAAVLSEVYAPDSPALRRDTALLRQLRRSRQTAHGVRLVARSVQVAEASPEQAVLDVVDVMPSYELVSADGAVTDQRPGRGAARWSVTLDLVAGQWRVLDVRRA